MSESTLAEDYRCLDLEPDATPLQVERAFRRKLALYSGEALATYALFDEAGRRAQLSRLEEAHRRICAEQVTAGAPRPAPAVEKASSPELADAPGRFLQARRETVGLTVKEVAGRTKISPMKLLQIEEERFELLPAPVYLRGFILAYARAVGLPDPREAAHVYLEHYRQRVAEA